MDNRIPSYITKCPSASRNIPWSINSGVVTGSFIVEQIFAIPDLVSTLFKVLQTVTIQ